MATVDGFFIGDVVEHTEVIPEVFYFDSPSDVPDLSGQKTAWEGNRDNYNKYKLIYKKMEKAQNQLTGLINNLLVGLNYILQSGESVKSVFSSLEYFKENTVDSLMSSLSDQNEEIISLQGDVDECIGLVEDKIETIDGKKKTVYGLIKDYEPKVKEGYYTYEALRTEERFEAGKNKTIYCYNMTHHFFSITEE